MRDRAELDPRPGGLYRIHVPGGRVAEGRFVALEPPHRIVFTWGWVGSRTLVYQAMRLASSTYWWAGVTISDD